MLSKLAFWRRGCEQDRSAPGGRRGWLTPGRRLYAIGDIHGRADLLERLLARIEADARGRAADHTSLVFLGDYVDRGPDSRRVLDMLTGGIGFADSVHFLRGNHEEALLAFLDDPARGPEWRRFGALELLVSYGVDVAEPRRGRGFESARDALAERLGPHLDFLNATAFSLRDGGYFFCHAGVRPGVALETQSPRDLCWIRNEFLESEADFGAVVVHGHTPVDSVDVRLNRINVDTGAYMTHRLSCVALQGDEVAILDTQDP